MRGGDALSILLLIRSLEVGGAERQVVQLATGLHERGHDVRVAVFYRRGPLLSDLEEHGIEIVDLSKAGRWAVVGFFSRLIGVLRRVRPDVIYSMLGGANIVAAAARAAVPHTKLIWSVRASDVDLAKYDWHLRAAYAVERGLSRRADLIISNSHAGRDFAVAHGFPEDRMAVVPNGIDTRRFRPDAPARARQRKEWAIADDQVAIGVLARLDPMKGHEVFLHAAALIAGDRPHMRFVCIGEGPERRRLESLASDLGLGGRLSFTGAASDPAVALNGLDTCCSPSLFGEGFSNAIGEAMACGLPCVVTDVGDSALLVGATGAVVPRSDPDALAQGMLAICDRLRAEGAADPRARIIENFSVDTMVDRTLQLLLELRDGNAASSPAPTRR